MTDQNLYDPEIPPPLLYDLAALSRFINSVLFNRPSDDPRYLEHQKGIREQLGIPEQVPVTTDMIAAAHALNDMIWGEGLHKEFKLPKRPMESQRRKTIDNPGFCCVMAALNEEITRKEAEQFIGELYGFADNRTAEKYFDSVKPSAQTTVDALILVHKVGFGDDFKVLLDDPKQLTADQQARLVCADNSLYGAVKAKRIQAIFKFSYKEAAQYLADNSPK